VRAVAQSRTTVGRNLGGPLARKADALSVSLGILAPIKKRSSLDEKPVRCVAAIRAALYATFVLRVGFGG
jgi:hypothetical protein